MKKLPANSVAPIAQYIRLWLDATEDFPSDPAPKIEWAIEQLPLVGDETPLVRVNAAPRDFIGEAIRITCAAEVDDYYNFGYSNAGPTHRRKARHVKATLYNPARFAGINTD